MTGAEAVKLLVDGGKVRMPKWPAGEHVSVVKFAPLSSTGRHLGGFSGVLGRDGWELYVPPATDEELVARFRFLSKDALRRWCHQEKKAWDCAAEMLSKRDVKAGKL